MPRNQYDILNKSNEKSETFPSCRQNSTETNGPPKQVTPCNHNRPTAFPDQVAVLQKIPSNDDANIAEVANLEYPIVTDEAHEFYIEFGGKIFQYNPKFQKQTISSPS